MDKVKIEVLTIGENKIRLVVNGEILLLSKGDVFYVEPSVNFKVDAKVQK